jgi:hypothetical protein
MNYSSSESSIINSHIRELCLDDCYNINLDSSLFEEHVFKEVNYFEINSGHLNSIQVDLFRSFKRLKTVSLEPHLLRNLIVKQGIEWMTYLNNDVNVNISNANELREKYNYVKAFIWAAHDDNFKNEKLQIAYDEDFSLFKNFPFMFRKIVIFIYTHEKEDNFSYSCPLLWLSTNYQRYYEPINDEWYYHMIPIPKEVNDNLTISKCDFQKRLDNCNKVNFIVSKVFYYFYYIN